MSQVVEAVFEHGVFKVLDNANLSLFEGQQVRLIVDADGKGPDEVLKLAAEVYSGLSSDDINTIEKISLDRKDFFGDRTRL